MTAVDSPAAAQYLAGADTGAAVSRADARYGAGVEAREVLHELTRETSTDFATIYFIRRLLADPRNRAWQRCFANAFAASTSVPAPYRFLFIPGFHYESDPSTGADFAGPRAALASRGYDVHLVEIAEDGTVEENAATIAAVVRAERKPLILVSTSKGGTDTALALGRLLAPDESRKVRAWISVGGLLNGTYLADETATWPVSWLAEIAYLWEGIDGRAIPGLRTEVSRRRMVSLRFPEHLLTVQLIGAPLSGQLRPSVRDRWETLAPFGPNDGLTLLADELVPGGHAVVAVGLDHFYRDPAIDRKAVALATCVVQELEKKKR